MIVCLKAMEGFFDIDRTMIDYDHAEEQASRELYREHRDSFEETEDAFVARLHELTDKHFARYKADEISFQEQRRERLRELFDRDFSAEEADMIFEQYLFHFENNWKLFDDVIPCLNALSEYRLGVISNGNYDQQTRKLEETGIKDRFGTVVISKDVGYWKPGRGIFHEACKRLGVEPGNSMYVGDNPEEDVEGSLAAGMKPVWLNRKSPDLFGGDVPTIYSLDALPAVVRRYGIPRKSTPLKSP